MRLTLSIIRILIVSDVHAGRSSSRILSSQSVILNLQVICKCPCRFYVTVMLQELHYQRVNEIRLVQSRLETGRVSFQNLLHNFSSLFLHHVVNVEDERSLTKVGINLLAWSFKADGWKDFTFSHVLESTAYSKG